MPKPKRVPKLSKCPTCGLSVQSGTGPHKLAWHDCDEVVALKATLTVEAVEQAVLRRIMEVKDQAKPTDLVAILRELRASRPEPSERGSVSTPGAAGSDAFSRWITGPRPA